MKMLFLFCLILWIGWGSSDYNSVFADDIVHPWNLPVFQNELPDYHFMLENSLGKHIPRHLWIGFKKIPSKEERSSYLNSVIDRAESANWTIHLMDDVATDNFMEKYFANTSVHWAYNIINPEVGAAKGDIWRYCALYLFGGFYLDDDAFIGSNLDDMIHDNDQLVMTWEKNKDHSACFLQHYKLSRDCLNERFQRKTETMFGGMILVTWAMATMPRHKLFKRAIETVVDTIRSQYIGQHIVYMGRYDQGYKWIFCSTGPNMITAVAREVFSEQENMTEHTTEHSYLPHNLLPSTNSNSSKVEPIENITYTYTLYARDFAPFGGKFKPVWTDPTKHYMYRMHHQHIPLLKAYGYDSLHDSNFLEGKLVTTDGRELFFIENGQRRGFENWDAFVDNQFNLRHARRISTEDMSRIVYNTTFITSAEAPALSARRKAREAEIEARKPRNCQPPMFEEE